MRNFTCLSGVIEEKKLPNFLVGAFLCSCISRLNRLSFISFTHWIILLMVGTVKWVNKNIPPLWCTSQWPKRMHQRWNTYDFSVMNSVNVIISVIQSVLTLRCQKQSVRPWGGASVSWVEEISVMHIRDPSSLQI